MTKAIEPEIWKQIKQFPSYAVSSHGRVKRIKKGRHTHIGKIIKPVLGIHKYYFQISLYESGKIHIKKVHHMVLNTFKNERPEGYECNHKDRNTINNNINNLEWVAHKNNIIHSISVLGNNRGESHGSHKLTESQVKQIREMYKTNNYTHCSLGKIFNITHVGIGRIIRRVTWRHI